MTPDATDSSPVAEAIAVLMRLGGCDAESAWASLAASARRHGLPVADVALKVVELGPDGIDQ